MATRKTPRARSKTSSRARRTQAKSRTAPKRRTTRPTQKRAGTGLTWGDESGGNQVPMRTVTPNLVPTDCATALDWYAQVFGAKELARMPGPGGKVMHAMMQIGDTVIMLSDNFGPPLEPQAQACAFLHIHDKAIERFWDRAQREGATVTMPLKPQFWGDTYGQLRDPFGITWSLGWPAKLTQAEKERLEREAMQQMEAQVR